MVEKTVLVDSTANLGEIRTCTRLLSEAPERDPDLSTGF